MLKIGEAKADWAIASANHKTKKLFLRLDICFPQFGVNIYQSAILGRRLSKLPKKRGI